MQMESGQGVPLPVYNAVRRDPGGEFPTTAQSLYDRYATIEWLRPWYFIPVVICLLIMVVYLLGKFIAARLGNDAAHAVPVDHFRIHQVHHGFRAHMVHG